jgi:hypothetical protein
MSKLLANQIANYNDNGPVEAKEGLNLPTGKPLQLNGIVGTSGQYLTTDGTSLQWTTLPTIPNAQVQVDWDEVVSSEVDYIKNKPALASVAVSGSYTDLINKPNIPAGQVQVDWNVGTPSALEYIKNKPAFAPVATTGAYTDLTGKPTIPTTLGDFGIGAQDINFGSYKITYSNVYATLTELQAVSASTYHGMFAHVHATGSGYFAHNNAWVELLDVNKSIANLSDVYTTGVTDGQVLKWDAGNSRWSPADDDNSGGGGGGGASVTVADSAPSTPSNGDLWWKSDEGRLKVRFEDGTSNQWVDANPPLAQLDLTAFGGHILPAGNDTQDIGSATKKIRDLYLGSNSLHLGSIDISESSGSIVLPAIEMTGHMIPDTNAAYDLGNAEYKIRHLFLSDNTLYYEGDFLKVAQHNSGGSAQTASYLIPLSKLKDALNASADFEAFKTAILAITDA